MALNDDTKNIAKKLGLSVPNDLSDEEVLSSIASQVGFDDYNNDEQSDVVLNNILHDMDADVANESALLNDNEIFDEMDDSFADVGPGYGMRPFGNIGRNKKSSRNMTPAPDNQSESTNNDLDTKNDSKKGKNENDEAAKALTTPTAANDVASKKQQSTSANENNKSSGVSTGDNSAKSRIRSNMNGNAPFGNGFSRDSRANSKRDDFNRDRFSFGKRLQKGREEEDNEPSRAFLNKSSKKGASGSTNSSDSGDKVGKKKNGLFKGKAANFLDKTAKTQEFLNNPFRMAAKTALKSLKHFLLTNPFVWAVIGLVLLFVIILFVCLGANSSSSGSNKNGGTQCTYDLKGVTNTGTVALDDVKVELVNCDATQSNYTVLETIDFEKYTLGVALAEIGPDSPDESIKAQIVAARNFALTRNSGMCPGNPDKCFYGYNTTTNKIRMRACEADQVYWDYEKDIYRSDRGSISIYSPEITSGTLWKSALAEQRKNEVLALANDVKGKVLVDSSGSVYATDYNSTKSSQFVSLANEGKTYDQILESVYGVGDFSSAKCHSTGGGNIDYGNYNLTSDGHEILHQDLSSFLSSKGTSLEEFNSLIESNVKKAGYGTRAGVVAAAVTLIAELGNNYQVKIPYYWGGGHESAINDYAKGNWGSTACHTYANGQSYNYCGLDCSGFVPWAIHNGGYGMSWAMLAGEFQNISGAQRVSLSNSAVLQAGDLLESSGHIVLVVGVDESAGQYICAEASGNSSGVLFTRRDFASSGYWGVKMDGYYDNSANVRG